MIKVAVTGGIGSGKSLVCGILQKMGVPVFYADAVSKELVNHSSEIRNRLISLLGKDIYLQNGMVHRKKLANIIFNDNIALQKVNSIIHPEVRKAFHIWSEKHVSAPYVVQEAAILFESGQAANFDKIITVTASVELKIERVMKRDNTTRELVLERMYNQLSDEVKIENSDFIIENDNREMILPQIISIHEKLIKQWQNLVNG